MDKKNKQKKTGGNKYEILAATAVLVISATFSSFRIGSADDSISQIDQSDGTSSTDTQQKIDELQKRADIYQQIIDIKKQQSSTLNDQLSITDTSMQQVQSQIDASTQQINDYNAQIIRLGDQIKEKETTIDSQKKILADLMQAYYEVTQRDPINAYLSDGNFASFLVTKDQLSQTGDKIKSLVSSVADLKDGLEAQSAELDAKKGDVVNAQQQLQDQSASLQTTKDQRATLLAQTKGEEDLYTQLLQRVQQQKQQLLDIDEYFAASGLSVDSYPKPDSKDFASTDWYFSQRDPRWGDETIGNTKTLMKSYGCAVTSVAMVFKEHGDNTDPGQLSSAPIFSGDLISWPSTWPDAKLTMSTNGDSHGNVDWSVIDAQIAKGNPVIVYIAKSNGQGGHYVVIHHKAADGQYVVHDPYFGPNIYLNTSRALIGAMGTDSSTSINQMIIYN